MTDPSERNPAIGTHELTMVIGQRQRPRQFVGVSDVSAVP